MSLKRRTFQWKLHKNAVTNEIKRKNTLKKYYFGKTKGSMGAKKEDMSSNRRTSGNPSVAQLNLPYFLFIVRWTGYGEV
jgi:hypothetical protein